LYEPPGLVLAVYPLVDSRLSRLGSNPARTEAKRLDKSHISEIARVYILKYDQVHYLIEIEDPDTLKDTRRFEELPTLKMRID